MPGAVELRQNGRAITELRLPAVAIPDEGGEARGPVVDLVVINTGTTKLMNVNVEPTGDNAKNVVLGGGQPGAVFRLADPLGPGEKRVVTARACYLANEAEDEKELELVVSATSMG